MNREYRRAISGAAAAVVVAATGLVWASVSSQGGSASGWTVAQATSPGPEEKPETPAEDGEAPEPANLVAEKKPPETNWSARCVNSDEGAVVDCRVTQNIALTKTGQRLLAVVVRIPTNSRTPAMTLNLPHGLFLPAGTTLQIDKTPPKEILVETCDAKGCYASLDVDDDLLTGLKKGSTLTVTFQNLAKQPIVVPVTLVGFTAAFAKIE